MFCPTCGAQISQGAGFCASCGNPVNASSPVAAAPVAPAMDYQAQMMQAQMMQAQQFQMQKNAVRQSEINALTQAFNYFNVKRASFQQYDQVCEQLNYFSRGAKGALMVWGIIVLAFGAIMCLGVFSGEMPLAGALAFLIPGGAMLTGGILMKANNKRKCAYYQGEYLRLSQELNDYYAAYPQCPVGAEYANPEILELILGVLNSGRADTIKEAINVLISEANQAEMTAYLQNIQAYSQQASARAGTAAIFAAASFFS